MVGGEAPAAIYNPGAGTAKPAASPPLAIEGGAAVVLKDGRILYAGGDTGGPALSAAYLFDPATQSWSAAASMNVARTNFTATVLNDGTVVIAGGSPAAENTVPVSPALNSAELYNPAINTFAMLAPMNVARTGQTATLLPNGSVLVTGGAAQNNTSALLASGEVFSLSSNSWTPVVNNMQIARFGHTATLLDTGLVLVTGTIAPFTPAGCVSKCNSVDLYSPALNSFSIAAPAPYNVYAHAATRLFDGNVMVTGGCCGSGTAPLGAVSVYNVPTNSWTMPGKLVAARYKHGASLLADGRLLLLGGIGAGGTPLASTEITNPPSGQDTQAFVAGANLPAAVSPDGALVLIPRQPNQVNLGVGNGGYQANLNNASTLTVTICAPGTTNCRQVSGIFADTGSTGLRVYASKLGGLNLPPIAVSGGQLGECENYGDGFAVWGPVVMADVTLGAHKATVPIQLGTDNFGSGSSRCGGINPNTPAGFYFNGLIGIGQNPIDEGTYYSCSGSACSAITPSAGQIIPNPITGLAADNNGAILAVPPIANHTAPSVYGLLTFGIGTESDNQPAPGVSTFSTTSFGYVNGVYKGTSQQTLFDSGTTTYFFVDSTIPQCTGLAAGFYCPPAILSLNATVTAISGSPTATIDFLVGPPSASLFGIDAVFDDLGTPGTSFPVTIFGLPYFLGHSVYVGIGGRPSVLGMGPFVAF